MTTDPIKLAIDALERAEKRHEKIRNALDFIRYGSFSRKDKDSSDGQAMADAGNHLSAARHELTEALTALQSQPASTGANERGDFDWAEMQRYIEEGADEPDWDASWVIDRVRTCIAANTPQPSPQPDMVAVPREVIQTLFDVHCNLRDDIGFQINIGSRPHGYQTEGYEQAWTKVFELLQPYTKGD